MIQTNDPERIGRLVAVAEQALPLAEIGSGPADQLGLGPEFAAHRRLGMLPQEMRRPAEGREPGAAVRQAAADEPRDDVRGRLRCPVERRDGRPAL